MLLAVWSEATKIYHRTKPQPVQLFQCFPPGILNCSLHLLKQKSFIIKEHAIVSWPLSIGKNQRTETRAELETHQSVLKVKQGDVNTATLRRSLPQTTPETTVIRCLVTFFRSEAVFHLTSIFLAWKEIETETANFIKKCLRNTNLWVG